MPPVKKNQGLTAADEAKIAAHPTVASVEADTLAPAPDVDQAELARLRRVIEDYEAAELKRETGAFTGVARCVNQACETYDTSAPIALVLEVKEMRSEDTPALVLSTSEYLHPVDDGDLACPKCGADRAIMQEEPRSYAPLAPR